ncbi:hypothetical protein GRI34_13150 [Erythrobacter aquimaris]|uniref:Barstar (barnase inhibitor) domain-containing protein n=1 Tax=Qipengyuania aquimaris TaxID=255984 RepID=A0A6I4TNB3_9SPHN|nr:barstar family protein [Qipengyuania aquimaris]MXO97362.1 hypothetical protein [Qipengyuania aquimaris]
MHTLKLDGSCWSSKEDFYDALAATLGSFSGHGRNADAFLETMVYYLHLNTIQPPYVVVVEDAPKALLPFLHDFASWVAEARQDRIDDPDWGEDIEVAVRVE